MKISLPTEFHPNQSKIDQMGAPWSSLIETKVSQLLYYKIPLQILPISFSFWAELTNSDKNFGVGTQDSCTRDIDEGLLLKVHQERLQEPWSPKNHVSIF